MHLPLCMFWALLGTTLIVYLNGPQSGDTGPVPSPSSGNLLEIQILEFYPQVTKSETLEVGPVLCVFTNCLGDVDAHLTLRSMVYLYWTNSCSFN